MAAAGLAHRRAVRPGRRRAPRRRPVPGPCRVQPGRARVGRGGVRRVDPRAERRDRAHQREPCGPARRRHARAGRGHRGPTAPQGGAPGGLDGLRGVVRRCRSRRRRRRRGRDLHRRRPGPGVAGVLGLVHRGAGPAAARPRPGRRDRGAVPRGGAGHPARRRHRGHAGHPRWCGHPAGHRRAGAGGHARAVHALRVRAGPGLRRDRRRVREPGTARRRGRRRRCLRRPGRHGAGRRGRGHRDGDRAEQPAAAAGAGTRGPARVATVRIDGGTG